LKDTISTFIKKYLIRSIIITVLLALLYLFFTSDFFSIKTVIVEPFSGSSISYIDKEAVKNDLVYNIDVNYFTINEKEIIKTIKDKYYIAENIVIEKQLPDRILVKIDEREPFLTLNINSSSCAVLDKSSFVFDMATTSESCIKTSINYSTYYVSLVNNSNIYNVNEVSNEFLTNSLEKIIEAIENNNFSIDTITVNSDYIEILLTDKSILIFQLGDDIDTEILRFYIVVEELNRDYKTFKTLDLRYERPIVNM